MSDMNDDILATLATYRPSVDSVEAEWSTTERAELLAQILSEPAAAPASRLRFKPRLRTVGVLAGIAAAAVIAVLVPTLLPSGSPGGPDAAAAASLHRLAQVAAGAAGPTVGPGQFQFTESVQTQYIGNPTGSAHSDQWQSGAGDVWEQTTSSAPSAWPTGCLYRPHDAPPTPSGSTNTTYRPDPRYPVFGSETQAFLNTLPTDPTTLYTYLHQHTQGGTSSDDAVFLAVADLLTNGVASPQLRAASIRVLALDQMHISVEADTHDSRGRTAIAVDYHDGHYVDALYFDPHTSQLLEARQGDDGGKTYWTRVVIRQSVTSAVPASVLSCVAAHPR
jgi:hypothetical protein